MEFPKSEIEALWAPWRVEYFSLDRSKMDFLAEAARATDDDAHLVVRRGKNCFLILNKYPYAVGHLMAVPYRKVADLAELSGQEKLELLDLASHAQRLLREVVKAQGFNVGLNLGRAAGAGVIDHLHLHIVPRWEGDNNFMPVLSGARVLSDSLAEMYAKLRQAQDAMQ
jgi:ATP adenylyltransferase